MKPSDEFINRKNEKNIWNTVRKFRFFLSETDLVTIHFRPVEDENAVLSLRSRSKEHFIVVSWQK